MADFTGRDRVRIAAGMCGWTVRDGAREDVLWLSQYRWIRVRYDSLDRIVEAFSHAQIGDGGPAIEQTLQPGPDRADQIVEWLAQLR